MSTNGKNGTTTTMSVRVLPALKDDFHATMEALGLNDSQGLTALLQWAIDHRRLPGDRDGGDAEGQTLLFDREDRQQAPPQQAPPPPADPQALRRELAAAVVLIVRLTLAGKPIDTPTAITAVKEALISGRLAEELLP